MPKVDLFIFSKWSQRRVSDLHKIGGGRILKMLFVLLGQPRAGDTEMWVFWTVQNVWYFYTEWGWWDCVIPHSEVDLMPFTLPTRVLAAFLFFSWYLLGVFQLIQLLHLYKLICWSYCHIGLWWVHKPNCFPMKWALRTFIPSSSRAN